MSNGSSFNQQWALGSDHAVSAPPPDTLSASHSILESLRKRRGLETAQWMNKLASEISLDQQSSVTSQQGLQPISPEDQKNHELVKWLDKLFDQFGLYANQFNSTAQGTDLIVTCTRPNLNQLMPTEETAGNNATEKIYEGHLVTRFWAMLLRGTPGAINVFIFPAEVLLGFSLHKIDETVYSPLLVIESSWKDNELSWHIGGTCITRQQIPLLAKELFGDLIRVASGQMDESELFAHPLQQMNLGENLAIGYKISVNGSKDLAVTFASVELSEKVLVSIDADVNQLIKLGKSALESEDTSTFQKIESLTVKMETLKETFKTALLEIAQITQSVQQKK